MYTRYGGRIHLIAVTSGRTLPAGFADTLDGRVDQGGASYWFHSKLGHVHIPVVALWGYLVFN